MLLRSFWGTGGRDWTYVRAWAHGKGLRGLLTRPPPAQAGRGSQREASALTCWNGPWQGPAQPPCESGGSSASPLTLQGLGHALPTAPGQGSAVGAATLPSLALRPGMSSVHLLPRRSQAPALGPPFHCSSCPPHGDQAPPTRPFLLSAWGLGSRGSWWLVTHMFRGYLCQDLRAGCAHHLHDALQLVDVCPAQEMPTGQARTFSGPQTPDLGALPRACSPTADPEPEVAWQGAEKARLARSSGAHLS